MENNRIKHSSLQMFMCMYTQRHTHESTHTCTTPHKHEHKVSQTDRNPTLSLSLSHTHTHTHTHIHTHTHDTRISANSMYQHVLNHSIQSPPLGRQVWNESAQNMSGNCQRQLREKGPSEFDCYTSLNTE